MPKRKKPLNAKPKRLINLISFGEGPYKGVVYETAVRAAQKRKEKRIIAVDVAKPNYGSPRSMKYKQIDAINYLTSVRADSVRVIRDDYALTNIALGELGIKIGKKESKEERIRLVHVDPKPEYFKNIKKYLKLVKRALVPGGRFLLTVDSHRKEPIIKELKEAGFRVYTKKLTKEEIEKHGSYMAKIELGKKEPVFRISAINPRPEKE